jgi:AcrR family transcriptional regulator
MDRDARLPTRGEVSRERVIDAAASIFAERGYAGTTMREVAKRVGFRAASLYYHYPSKEDLIEAVLATGMNALSKSVNLTLTELPATATARDRIEAAMFAHLECVVRFGDYSLASRRAIGQVPNHVRRRLVAMRDAYSDLWLELLEQARANGELRDDVDTHLARTFILGALNSVLDWYRPNGKTPRELAKQFAILSDGMFRRTRS